MGEIPLLQQFMKTYMLFRMSLAPYDTRAVEIAEKAFSVAWNN